MVVIAPSGMFVTIVRHLINDVVSPFTFTDDRLRETIAVAGQLVLHELTFNVTYTINIPTKNITPDPTVTPDNNFINLISLKAACVIDKGTFRASLGENVRVKIGTDEIDARGTMEGQAKLLTLGNCGAYEQAKLEYMAAGNHIAGQAIIGPILSFVSTQTHRDRTTFS